MAGRRWGVHSAGDWLYVNGPRIRETTREFFEAVVETAAETLLDYWNRRMDRQIETVMLGILTQEEFRSAGLNRGVSHHLRTAIRPQTPEIQKDVEEQRTIYQFVLSVSVLVLTICLLGAGALVEGAIRRGWTGWPAAGSWPERMTDDAGYVMLPLGFPSLGTGLLALVGTLVLAVLVTRAMAGSVVEARQEWIDGIALSLVPRIRTALNKYANADHPTKLIVDVAPGLGDADTRDRHVERPETERIGHLFTQLGVRTIAVSGARGVGKTTLLRMLADRRLTVAAPVSYDPLDFLVHLYSTVCKHALDVTRSYSRKWVYRALAAARILLKLLAVAAVTLVWGIPLIAGRPGFAIPAKILMTATLIAGYRAADRLRTRKAPRNTRAMTKLANADLRRLRFIQTSIHERSGAFKRGGFEMGGKRARQLAEKALTLPELVSEYHEFVSRFVVWMREDTTGANDHLTIGIDEVDRMASAEDAEKFLNDVKAVFGDRHCRYIVTVSEDALAGFERRVVRLRPALDSAFDEVLRLGEFSYRQSADLLDRSVAGFSNGFVALCHCLSGGIPRDLIRAARALVDQRKATGDDDLNRLTASLVQHEIQTLKRGLTHRFPAHEHGDAEAFLSALADPSWPTTSTETMLVAVAALLDGSTKDHHRSELALAVYFYATVQDLFCLRLDTVLTETRSKDGTPILDAVVAIRGMLPVSAALTLSQLNKLRQELGLRTS